MKAIDVEAAGKTGSAVAEQALALGHEITTFALDAGAFRGSTDVRSAEFCSPFEQATTAA